MKRSTKIIAGVVLLAGAGAGTYAGVNYYNNKDIVTVQAGQVVRQDLTQTVASTGEIKPKKSVNISSNAMGRIVRMPVKEGDRVKQGDLAHQSSSRSKRPPTLKPHRRCWQPVRPNWTRWTRRSNRTTPPSRPPKQKSPALKTDLSRSKLNLDRAESLSKDGLIPREQYDHTKADYDVSVSQLNAAKARLAQAEAQAAQTLKQRDGTKLRLAQQRTSLIRAQDQLEKTTITSPLKGIITYLPVNEGEIAIIGVQNQPGTTLMTIADMSVITAEVKVDETDIVNVHLGQEAEIKVDALGDKVLKGHVSDVGNSAVNRSGQQNQNGNQEAKDFKVVITLDDPPEELRPGLSCTARIITARTKGVLTIPIQALTVREFDDPADPLKRKKLEKEGVYILKDDMVVFKQVKTGITGTTDIEILEGLTEKERIVTGPYQVLALARRQQESQSRRRREEVMPADLARNESLIRTENLWKTYFMGGSEVHALHGVTFEIRRNEYVAIMGPSGSGKSTLMNLIGCPRHTDPGPVLAERQAGQ
jgi:HlyD family secretion protein